MRGEIKFFNESKGFGFIEQKDNENDMFFHCSQVLSEGILRTGDQVTYEVGEGREGREAAQKVQLVEE